MSRFKVWANTNSLTQPRLTEMSVPRKKVSGHVYVCVRDIHFDSIDFVPTMNMFLLFLLLRSQKSYRSTCNTITDSNINFKHFFVIGTQPKYLVNKIYISRLRIGQC